MELDRIKILLIDDKPESLIRPERLRRHSNSGSMMRTTHRL